MGIHNHMNNLFGTTTDKSTGVEQKGFFPNLIDYFSGKESNSQRRQLALANSEFQRGVQDMKLAGINPITMSSASSARASSDIGDKESGAVNSLMSMAGMALNTVSRVATMATSARQLNEANKLGRAMTITTSRQMDNRTRVTKRWKDF